MAIRGPVIDATNARYIKHPPGGSGWLQDGAPLDSGTAHILHNNLSVLSNENTRHLGNAVGPGKVGLVETAGLWLSPGFVDVSAEAGADEYGQHPWVVGKTAAAFGPYVPAFTRLGTSPAGMWPRKVRVMVVVNKSATAASVLTLMACLVKGQGSPLRAPVVAKKKTAVLDTSSGKRYVQLDLSPDAPLAPSASWPSDSPGSGAPSMTRVCPLWVWVGWLSNDAASLDSIISISAMEIAE